MKSKTITNTSVAIILITILACPSVQASADETAGIDRAMLPPVSVSSQLFAYGPKCELHLPSIHVYDSSQQRFLGGQELDETFSAIADQVESRTNPGDQCSPEVERSTLEAHIGKNLPAEGGLVVIFADLLGMPPFEQFPSRIRAHRDELYEKFLAIDVADKTLLQSQKFEFD